MTRIRAHRTEKIFASCLQVRTEAATITIITRKTGDPAAVKEVIPDIIEVVGTNIAAEAAETQMPTASSAIHPTLMVVGEVEEEAAVEVVLPVAAEEVETVEAGEDEEATILLMTFRTLAVMGRREAPIKTLGQTTMMDLLALALAVVDRDLGQVARGIIRSFPLSEVVEGYRMGSHDFPPGCKIW